MNTSRIESGIYFGLDEDAYHGDPAIGSTDIRKLSYSPHDYWFGSALNEEQEKEDTSTPAQIFGRGVHKMVLEGRQAFEADFAACEYPGNIKAGKEERAAIEAAGKTPLKADEFKRILTAGEAINANPHLAEAFHAGVPEVSVFWDTPDGIRKKARFDFLKTRAIVDLKSIRNSRSIGFVEACRRALAEWNYPVQAEHYREGRNAMAALVDAGAVHGDHDPAWLRAVADNAEWAFVFCFWQAEGAPLTWATMLSPGNPVFDIARSTIAQAEANYAEFMSRFGPAKPWLLDEPLVELDITHLPAWWGRS